MQRSLFDFFPDYLGAITRLRSIFYPIVAEYRYKKRRVKYQEPTVWMITGIINYKILPEDISICTSGQ